MVEQNQEISSEGKLMSEEALLQLINHCKSESAGGGGESADYNKNILSVNETAVGIIQMTKDGVLKEKKYYRLLLENLTQTNGYYEKDVSNLNIELVLKLDAIGSDNENYTPPIWTINSTSGVSNREIYIDNRGVARFNGNYIVYYGIIEYTKTTDEWTEVEETT